MKKAVGIVFCLLLLCLFVTPAAAEYIWDPQPVYKGIQTTIQVSNTFIDRTLEGCVLDYGDGSSSYPVDIAANAVVNFKHTYTSTGTYTLTLTVEGNPGLTNTRTITVTNPQTVNIVADNEFMLPNTEVTFSAASAAGTINSATWNFGDGTTGTSTGRTIKHTYTAAGTYTVSVTASVSGGITDTGSSPNLIRVVNAPTVSAVTVSPTSQNVNNAVTASISYTAGTSSLPKGYTAYIHVDDGITTADYAVSSYSSPISRTITYTTQGTKTISAYGFISGNGKTLNSPTTRTATVTITPPKPAGLSFTMSPADGEIQVGESVTFTASAGSGGSVDSYTWNYGDGSAAETKTTSQTTHTYQTTGTYTVSVTATGPGGSTTYSKTNAVHVGETYVRLDKTTYYINVDSAIEATYSLSPYSSTSVYTLELWQLNDLYEPVSRVSSITLNAATGTQSFSISGVTSNTNYNVYLVTGGGYLATAPATVRYNGDTLTVILYGGSTILTSQAEVLLQQDGETKETRTISNGRAVFAPLTRGATYTIVASAEGYRQESSTVTMSGDTSVTLTLGTALNTGGWGQWEPTTCSWQVFDKNGRPLSGVSVELQQVAESFGNLEIFNEWNGFILGNKLLGSPQTLFTDSYGMVTFNTFKSAYYQLKFTYAGTTTTKYYNTGTAAATITVNLGSTDTDTKSLYQLVYAEVESDQNEGTITVTYTDTATPKVTNTISIQILDSTGAAVAQWGAPANSANQVFTISDRYNHDFTVQITADTTLGQYTKTYSLHFNGSRLSFGLPEGLLIWLSVFALFAVGGIFGRFTIGMGCMAVSIIAWVLYGIGWLWQLEAAVTAVGLGVILFFATLVSIMFMIAEQR